MFIYVDLEIGFCILLLLMYLYLLWCDWLVVEIVRVFLVIKVLLFVVFI